MMAGLILCVCAGEDIRFVVYIDNKYVDGVPSAYCTNWMDRETMLTHPRKQMVADAS